MRGYPLLYGDAGMHPKRESQLIMDLALVFDMHDKLLVFCSNLVPEPHGSLK